MIKNMFKKGYKQSDEHKKKIGLSNSISQKGLKHSEETKRKISESNIGKHFYWKGKKFTKEHRDKMGMSSKNRLHPKGWKLSEETRRKMSESRKGDKTNFWKGGVTAINAKIRSSLEYKLWREAVIKRDNYKCIWCGQDKTRLEVDHIMPMSVITRKFKIKSLEEALNCNDFWDINNGRTLCVPCHKKTETYGFYRLYKVLKEYDSF